MFAPKRRERRRNARRFLYRWVCKRLIQARKLSTVERGGDNDQIGDGEYKKGNDTKGIKDSAKKKRTRTALAQPLV